MTTQLQKTVPYLFAAALSLAAGPAAAQALEGTIGPTMALSQLLVVIANSLPPILTEDNTGVVRQMLGAKLAPPLSQTFSLAAAKQGVFGFAQPAQGPDCGRTGTPVGEPDQGECNLTLGTPEGPGAFKQLSFSKNLGVGNIRYLRRDGLVDPANIPPVTLDDPSVQKLAVNFMFKFFGMQPGEFPFPPSTAPNQNPFVTTLTLGGADTLGGQVKPVGIAKLVNIPRGLLVSLTDSTGAVVMPFVPAPGRAQVLVSDKGVIGAMIENWQELRVDPAMNPQNAKTKTQLVNEIAQDLIGEVGGGAARIAHVSAHIVYHSDFRGTFGLLVPAVQVYATPVSGELSLAQFDQIVAGHIGTAGIVREYSLVATPQSAPAETR
jgi:hypothetical protein